MSSLSIKHKILSLVLGIIILFGLLLTFFSPYQSRQLGQKLLRHKAEFLVRLISEELSRGVREKKSDQEMALERTLDLFRNIVPDGGNTVIYIKVYNPQMRFMAGLNTLSETPPAFRAIGRAVFEEDEAMLTAWLPLRDLNQHLNGYVEIAFSKAFLNAEITRNRFDALIFAFLASVVVLFMGVMVVRSIIKSLETLSNAAAQVASGEVNVSFKIRSRDEIGQLSRSFITLIKATKDLAHAANAIGKGDYQVPVEVRSEKDILGKAILEMRNNLIAISEENQQQNWLKNSQAELSDIMRGDPELRSLCQKIIRYLAKILNAQIGIIYLYKDGRLKFSGGYACQDKEHIARNFRVGEGLVGQVARDRQMIMLHELPEHYVSISSGSGTVVPKCLLMIPFLYENKIKGVIELGSLSTFTTSQVDFLVQAGDNIAIAVNTAQSRVRLSKLLEMTRRQAENLRHQQEELQKTNKELEQQTSALKVSHTQLEFQQEELRTTNEALEEQTHILEKQRDDISSKNTELEIAHSEIEAKAKDLELANKYKSEFLANMSHELRTPLNSLLILAKLLTENKHGNLTGKQIKFAETIHAAGSDLLKLINDILDLSRVEAGRSELHVEAVDLNEVYDHVERNFQQAARQKELYLDIDLEGRLPERMYTDRQRLEQILRNLLANAIKFTEAGGICLRIYRPSEKCDLSNSGLAPQDAIAFAVIDTGQGIAEDKQSLIFEAFRQEDGSVNRKYGGTGLGLSISQEFTRLLGGELQLKSEKGIGSTFTLYLPIIHRQVEEEKNSTFFGKSGDISQKPVATQGVVVAIPANVDTSDLLKEEEQPRGITSDTSLKDDREQLISTDRRLLIVEDDQKFSEILLELAREHGFKCLVSSYGEEGYELAVEYQPSAILLDIVLPDISGWMVIEKLKTAPRTRHIPVYVISVLDKTRDALNMGAVGFLAKPVVPEILEALFKNIDVYLSASLLNILLVEHHKPRQQQILKPVNGERVNMAVVESAVDAYAQLGLRQYDCVMLGDTNDAAEFALLEKLVRDRRSFTPPPIMVCPGKSLSEAAAKQLQVYARELSIQVIPSPEKFLEETLAFLQKIDVQLSDEAAERSGKIPDQENLLDGKRILLVDDDMRNVFALASIMEEKGLQVVIARNGREGLAALNTHRDIDLILMDIMMPEMDGYTAIQEVRSQARFDELPIIALTAKAMKEDQEKCLQVGANDYIAKPVTSDQLLSLIAIWLKRKKTGITPNGSG